MLTREFIFIQTFEMKQLAALKLSRFSSFIIASYLWGNEGQSYYINVRERLQMTSPPLA